MPRLALPDRSIYYRLDGRDGAPVIALSHSLGQDHTMWDLQAAALGDSFRVLRYDTRGHGASSAPAGDYSVEQLGGDVIALADALDLRQFAFCGLSLGGMIAMWLAVHAADRVTAIVLANTSARPDPKRMEARRQAALAGGMASITADVMGRFFSSSMLSANDTRVAQSRRTLLATNPIGYAGCCAAIRDFDFTASLAGVRTRALIISSELDRSLPWTGHGDAIAAALPDAEVQLIPTAHLSNLEAPATFNAALFAFLSPIADSSARDAGLRLRRAVLGDAHVDRALATHPSAAFQDLITEFAWGRVWARPGLDVRTRRLIALAIAAANNRWEEFRMHVRTGLQRELEWCDVEEVLLHTAVYAGAPAANTGLHLAEQERRALETPGQQNER